MHPRGALSLRGGATDGPLSPVYAQFPSEPDARTVDSVLREAVPYFGYKLINRRSNDFSANRSALEADGADVEFPSPRVIYTFFLSTLGVY